MVVAPETVGTPEGGCAELGRAPKAGAVFAPPGAKAHGQAGGQRKDPFRELQVLSSRKALSGTGVEM